MSEETEFNMYKNIVNNYFRTATFEKAKELCVRDMVQLNQRYITEAVCRNEALNRADKLQKELENLKEVDRQICCEELITKDKYQDILKENDNLNKKNKRYEKYLKNKDIEHNKVLEYIETEKERDYISKDIIRNKIKELEEVKQKEEKENKDEFGINSNTWAIADWGIEVLKELLGE